MTFGTKSQAVMISIPLFHTLHLRKLAVMTRAPAEVERNTRTAAEEEIKKESNDVTH